jgi:hypothetical protein
VGRGTRDADDVVAVPTVAAGAEQAAAASIAMAHAASHVFFTCIGCTSRAAGSYRHPTAAA